MFSGIETISKSFAIVGIKYDESLLRDLSNVNVVFESDDSKILGSIDSINKTNVKVNFLGEITNDTFIPGLIKRPKLNSVVRIITTDELKLLIGNEVNSFTVGTSATYKNFPIKVKYNDLFSNHTAFFGNSGSGKTNGICRIIQNIFFNSSNTPYNANLFIFDSYGEYINAFSNVNKFNPKVNYKLISTTSKTDVPCQKLKIPFGILTADDILNLLDATEYGQVSIIQNALQIAKIFAVNDPNINDYKNHLIAKAITAILYTNQSASKIRDQIFDLLSGTHTKELSLSTEIEEVGFTRSLIKCLEIDSEGRFAERTIFTKYIESFIKDDASFNINQSSKNYGLKEFQIALNFTLLNERYLLNEKMYDDAISLKARLGNLINSRYSEFFVKDEQLSNTFLYLNDLVMINGNKAQIININLEDVDDTFARTIVKIYSRMFLKYTRSLKDRASCPIHIILEEAHRYVRENDDIKVIGYNIFERIAKEGRKYGLILDIITQRPTELNPNIVSQVDNFLIFKITHPIDLDYITKTIPSIDEDVVEKQKTLQPGTCVAFGRILKLPMVIKLEKANPEPSSANCDIYKTWMS